MNKEHLFDMMTSAQDLGSFIESCARMLGNPMWIMDEAYRMIAASKAPKVPDFLKDFDEGNTTKHIAVWLDQGLLGDMTGNHKPFRMKDPDTGMPLVLIDIFEKNMPVAKMTIVEDHPVQDDTVLMIARAAGVFLRNHNMMRGTGFEQPFALLLSGDAGSEETGRKLLRELGYTGQKPYRVLFLDTNLKNRSELLAAFVQDLHMRDPMLIGAMIDNRCLVLTSAGHDIPKDINLTSIRIGESFPFDMLRNIQDYAREAESAILFGKEKREAFRNHYEAYISSCICKEMKDEASLILPEIRAMRAYDEEYGTEYTKTLKIYIRCHFSKTETAEQLEIHLNTVKYRITQMEKLFNIDFQKDLLGYISSVLLIDHQKRTS